MRYRKIGGTMVLIGVLALAGTTLAAGVNSHRGRCTSAMLDEPVALPGGNVVPPGQLRLCIRQHYSPVSTIHDVQQNGHTLAFVISRRGAAGETDEPGEPFMMFERQPDGMLRLAGYSLPIAQGMVTYKIARPGEGARSREAAPREPTAQSRPTTDVLVAARVD